MLYQHLSWYIDAKPNPSTLTQLLALTLTLTLKWSAMMENRGSDSDYQAIILACGDSGRLYPLTEDTPISLLPIANFPLLNIQVEALARVGFKSVLVVVAEESVAQVIGVDILLALFLVFIILVPPLCSVLLRWCTCCSVFMVMVVVLLYVCLY